MLKLEQALKEDAKAILELYHSVLDTPGCRWNMEYPSMENIEEDLAGNDLFCLKENDEIISVISVEHDESVDVLECWSRNLLPAMEVARLCVRSDYQGKGIAGKMVEAMVAYAKDNNFKSVRYLVAKKNLTAQKAYSKLGFKQVGETQCYGDDYFCCEKEI